MTDSEALIADARLLARTGEGQRARELAGASVESVAAAVGVPVPQLVAWELGELEPDGTAAADWVHVVRGLFHHQDPVEQV